MTRRGAGRKPRKGRQTEILVKNNKELIGEIIKDIRRDMSDEEVLALLAGSKISVDPNKTAKKNATIGQRAADRIAKFAGSWAFIFSFVGVLAAWMAINIILATRAFDPYPFILLNLVLSCVAAIQAPLIMMSQNRQEEKDRARAENDYKVNLKTEILIEDLYKKVTRLLARQEAAARAEEAEGKEHAEEHTHEPAANVVKAHGASAGDTHEPAASREVKAHGASESSETHCRPKGKA